MSGAMAGTALLSAPYVEFELDTVVLTVNNDCNLKCPHCYLQYTPAGTETIIPQEVIDAVLSSSCRHICIAGKEPLANARSRDIVEAIILEASKRNISTSLITNGLQLHKLSSTTVSQLSWVDVSLDGGPATYGSYRGASFNQVMSNIRRVRTCSGTSVRILNTISHENLEHIPDMVDVFRFANIDLMQFSPFQETKSQGEQYTTMVRPETFFEAFSDLKVEPADRIVLAIDAQYVAKCNALPHDIELLVRNSSKYRIDYTKEDPLIRGFIRITYDGLVLSPIDSLNTKYYSCIGSDLGKTRIEEHYNKLISDRDYDALVA